MSEFVVDYCSLEDVLLEIKKPGKVYVWTELGGGRDYIQANKAHLLRVLKKRSPDYESLDSEKLHAHRISYADGSPSPLFID